MLCTGYRFCFPFLDPKDALINLSYNDRYFGPLYKRMFSLNEPDMIFTGIHNGLYGHMFNERVCIAAREYIKGNV